MQFREPQYDLPRTGRWAGEVGASVLQALLRPIVQQAVAVTAPVAASAGSGSGPCARWAFSLRGRSPQVTLD